MKILLRKIKALLESYGLWRFVDPLYRITLARWFQVPHGHDILLTTISKQFDKNHLIGKTLIEIGSTRENLAGQGSTAILADFCLNNSMHFISVDMDPENTDQASVTLSKRNPNFEAINAKGEEYISNFSGKIDFLYLDAFDIDHGKHSVNRQNKYKENLGVDISNELCWKMHLESVLVLPEKMPSGAIVSFDDTWLNSQNNWEGKGKLAMPFLLGNGFKIEDVTAMTVSLRKSTT